MDRDRSFLRDPRKPDGKTNRHSERNGVWEWVGIPSGRFIPSESQMRIEGLSENLREILKQFEVGIKGHNGNQT